LLPGMERAGGEAEVAIGRHKVQGSKWPGR
jgi:hypothetical protein